MIGIFSISAFVATQNDMHAKELMSHNVIHRKLDIIGGIVKAPSLLLLMLIRHYHQAAA
jgi:hypothetical protein